MTTENSHFLVAVIFLNAYSTFSVINHELTFVWNKFIGGCSLVATKLFANRREGFFCDLTEERAAGGFILRFT